MKSGGHSGPYSVIFVDDDPSMLALATAFFESDGRFSITCFGDAEEAFEAFTSGRYDAIISDYDMPRMTGLDLLRMVRDYDPESPFIMITGRSREEIVVDAIQAGVSYYLNKGIDTNSFFAELIHVTVIGILACRARNQVRESETLFRNLAERIQGIIYRMSLPDGAFIYVSPGVTQITGYTPEELYADPGIIFDIVHPDWKEYHDGLCKEIISGNAPQVFEFPIVHKDGSIRWIRHKNTLVRNEKGNSIFLEAIVSDITRETETMTKLCEREELYRTLFEVCNEAIFIREVDGQILDVNEAACRMFGYTKKELLEHTCFDITGEQYRKKYDEIVCLLETLGNTVIHLEGIRKDGSRFPIEATIRMITYEGTRRVVSFVHDLPDTSPFHENKRQDHGFIVIPQV